MIFCEKCGAEIPNKAKFCRECGSKTTKVIEKTIKEKSKTTQPANKIKSKRTLIITGMFLGVVSICIIAIVVTNAHQNTNETLLSNKISNTKTINGIECVLVNAGEFMMGNPKSGEKEQFSDETYHKVILTKDFYISKYEIKQKQYESIMKNNPSNTKGDNLPVESVTWYNAYDFCKKAGGRLPTEAEWEFAARGGNKSKNYIYSGSKDLNEVGWYSNNNSGKTHIVGQKEPNELGIYDMSGNVWEWCNDWYDDYGNETRTNPTGAEYGSIRVNRGGGWYSYAQSCRVAKRDNYAPSFSSDDLGFRIVFDVE